MGHLSLEGCSKESSFMYVRRPRYHLLRTAQKVGPVPRESQLQSDANQSRRKLLQTAGSWSIHIFHVLKAACLWIAESLPPGENSSGKPCSFNRRIRGVVRFFRCPSSNSIEQSAVSRYQRRLPLDHTYPPKQMILLGYTSSRCMKQIWSFIASQYRARNAP